MRVVIFNSIMSHLLHIALCVLLSFQFAVADPASTFLRSSKSSSLATKSLLSALLVRRGKFNPRQGYEWCPSGYVLCGGNSDECSPVGYYCCSDSSYSCPYGTNCLSYGCCPETAQTCNGNTCCDTFSSCCNDNTCCDFGTFCCNDSSGGCAARPDLRA
ncbi:hypothetical protein EDD22DRAFT_401967 [Suillus occidentalis]|nr:hypothetical protein EDD22DRAFT_401967 [Suillus occidentalis]